MHALPQTRPPFAPQYGYQAPPTPPKGHDCPWVVFGPLLDGCEFESLPPGGPPSLTLSAQITLEEVDGKGPLLSLQVGSETLKPVHLYDPLASAQSVHPRSRVKALSLHTQGRGFYDMGEGACALVDGKGPGFELQLDPSGLLIRFPFQVDERPLVMDRCLQDGGRPHPFGGFWEGKMESARQMVYTLTEEYPGQTRVSLSPTPAGDASPRLGDLIRSGGLSVSVLCPDLKSYHSTVFSQKSPETLDITFVPETERPLP
jgi:hypothetical protein